MISGYFQRGIKILIWYDIDIYI